MGGVKVKRIDGGSAQPSGISFRRLGAVRANIRRGYQVEMLPYPREDGKWLIRVVRPKRGNVPSAEVDSYFEVIAKSQDEAEAFIKKDGLWGGALAERVAHRIGKRGEAHAVAKLSSGRVVDSVTGKGMSFGQVKQYQNPSGHGVDILAQISAVDPPPPPNAGDFVAFEVKSTLGAVDDPPRLSKMQQNPGKKGGFVETRLARAQDGAKAGYPSFSDDEIDTLTEAMFSIRTGRMLFRKIDIRMDHSGNLGSAGGKPPMEIKSWQ